MTPKKRNVKYDLETPKYEDIYYPTEDKGENKIKKNKKNILV